MNLVNKLFGMFEGKCRECNKRLTHYVMNGNDCKVCDNGHWEW